MYAETTPDSNKLQNRFWIISSPQYGACHYKNEIPLPVFFTNSTNNKYIEVRNVKVIYNDTLVNDLKFHSTLVNEDPFDDNFVCFTNEIFPKTYKWNSSSKTIKIWFSDMANNYQIIDHWLVDILLWY
jgi:hypothetical protein